MDTKALNEMGRLSLIAERIREMRDILGFSVEEMAEKTEVSKEEYELYEQGKTDMPFTFLHKCSLVLGIQLMELLQCVPATFPYPSSSRIWRPISRKR